MSSSSSTDHEQHTADEKSHPHAQPPRPFSHRFNDDHPQFSQNRSLFFKIVIGNVVLITLTVWIILPIYWGALWKINTGVHNLNGWIVDFDGGPIGQTVTQAFLNTTGPKTHLDWKVVPPSTFPNGPADFTEQLVNERAWAIIAINSGASDRLQAAIAAKDPSYDGSKAVTAWGIEARNEQAYRSSIFPQMQQTLGQTIAIFARQSARQLGDQSGALLAAAPGVVLTPLNYTVANVRPFDIPVATAVQFVGLIYLVILAFISCMAGFAARTQATQLEHHMTIKHLVLFRLAVPFIVYFWLSLAFGLLSVFFQVPFNRHFGHAGFLVVWMVLYVGMLALGLAMETMITILTPKFIAFFLALWIIVNVSVSLFPIEIMPTIYRYGYAMPFYNVQRVVRTVLFSTRNQVGINFAILIGWIIVSMITLPLVTIYSRKQAIKAANKTRQD